MFVFGTSATLFLMAANAERPARGRKALRAENERLRNNLTALTAEVDSLRSDVEYLRLTGDRLADRLAFADGLAAVGAAQVAEWTQYATALGQTTAGLQAWVDWYAAAVAEGQEQLNEALSTVTDLRFELADREMRLAAAEAALAVPAQAPAAELEPARASSDGVEAVLREQVSDLRRRLDHAGELVDEVVRRLVAPTAQATAAAGIRLQLPLIDSDFEEPQLMSPIDLVEDYPWLQDRPTA